MLTETSVPLVRTSISSGRTTFSCKRWEPNGHDPPQSQGFYRRHLTVTFDFVFGTPKYT
jgi:hypothetical protein